MIGRKRHMGVSKNQGPFFRVLIVSIIICRGLYRASGFWKLTHQLNVGAWTARHVGCWQVAE